VSSKSGYWKTHPKKDLQALLMRFHKLGWKIVDPPTYYKVYCPCKRHKTTVHLSPSNPNYILDKTKWLERQSCYKEDKEGAK
jgi:hypothetical protein